MNRFYSWSLAFVVFATPMSWSVQAAAQGANVVKNLEQRFIAAQASYEAGDYEKAYEEFDSLARATGSPNAELYLGRCLRELGRLPEAYEATAKALEVALTRAAADAKYEQTRNAAAADLAKLELRVSKIIVAVADPPEGLQVTVNGNRLPQEKLGTTIAVNIGKSVVVVEAPEKKRIERHLNLAGGKTETVTIALEDLNAQTPPAQVAKPTTMTGGTARKVGFVVAGIGVVGMGTFAVAGIMANQRYDEIYAACGGTHCTDQKYGPEIESGQNLDLLANVGLGVGIGGIAVGTLLIALGGPKPSSVPAVSGYWVPGAGGISLRGSF